MRKIILFLILVLGVGVAFFFLQPVPAASVRRDVITIRDQQLMIEIARTGAEQERGLSGHAPLAANAGMLFPFPSGSMPGFWMKDMLFPIDMIWIADGRVVGFVERAAPDDRPTRTVYYPPQPISDVLEVAAGTVARLGVQVGDTLQ